MLREITVDGRVYVDKKDLVKLIREHKKETKAGKKPGFIEEDEGKRLSAYMALNHLQARVCEREAMEAAKRNIAQMDEKKRAEDREHKNAEKRKRVIVAFTTGKDGARKMDYFAAWVRLKPELPEKVRKQLQDIGLKEEESAPMFASDWENALVFTDPEFAHVQAERVKAFFGKGDDVVALPFGDVQTESVRRLLLAIFSGDRDDAAD